MPATKQYIDCTIKPRINITIFASPKPLKNNIATIQINAIKSWKQLQPKPEIILCGDELGTAEIAKQLNIRHFPNIKCNQYGTPLLNDIFAKVSATAKNSILVYVNSDIILTSDFLPVVQQVAAKHPRFLILGRRWNLDINEAIDFEDFKWEEKLSERLQKNGTCSGVGALDYFVFPKPLFSQLPKFAIGRPGWDNWMVGNALKNNIPVINASLVIKPIHQNHDYSHLRGNRIEAFQGEEARENERLLRREGRAGNSADATWYLAPIATFNNPSVSVVVVGKNNREILGEQSYRDYELIAIDDTVHKVAARNEGLAKAKGEFVVFWEGDVASATLFPDALAAQINCFENKAASLEMVFGGWQLDPPRPPLERGEMSYPPRPPLERGEMEVVEPWHQLATVLKGREGLQGVHIWMLPHLWRLINLNSMMFRRSWLENVGGFDVSLSPEAATIDLVLNLSLKGAAGFCLEKPIFRQSQPPPFGREKIALLERDSQKLIDKYFSRPYLPQWMNVLRGRAEFNTYVWLAWLMFAAGDNLGMEGYLGRSRSVADAISLSVSPYSPSETLLNWEESFKLFAREDGKSFDVKLWQSLKDKLMKTIA
jgi:hypothetical protein